MAKVIITGVDGNFGGYAANSISQKLPLSDLIFTSPNSESLEKYKAAGVDCRNADFTNAVQLTEAFSGGSTLLLISMPQVGETRRRMHANAINAAVKAGVNRIVYTSIVGAGELENCAYEIFDHKFTEALIKTTPLNYVFLRDSQYCESMISAFEQSADSDGLLSNNMGDGCIAHVARFDCAEAAACVAAGSGKNNVEYYITGPELMNMKEFCKLGSEITGRRVEYKYLTDEKMYEHFDSLGVPRETDGIWAESAKAFPFCGKGMVTFGTAIRLDQMSFCTDDFNKLTGKKPLSVREMFEDIDNHRIGIRNATDS